ncbi:MAG: hypothetical protein HN509_00035 [Halobacteriovoraceae bacterium]|jgi:hypothetical protein|nr:hypothetical protein [Halobacteriovoraceae bacterium]MBT5095160.1 hypothetical protein [Halobacteriovoraceae bacterium]
MNKKIISEDQLNELKGFEDVLDLILDGKSLHTLDKKSQKSHDNYDLYNFLEQESVRLFYIDSFFGSKLKNIERFPQTELLLEKQKGNRSLMKEELTEILGRKDSPLLKHLKGAFESAFKE